MLLAEECYNVRSTPIPTISTYKLHNDSADLDIHGSPKKKTRIVFSGIKQIDHLIHTAINYILRDYIESWFMSLSNNKEFSDFRVRNSIEDSIQNVCARIKNTQWIPLMTTKLVDNLATHARLYRLAKETVNLALDDCDGKKSTYKNGERESPLKRNIAGARAQQHRRNKSDTDLSRYAYGGRNNGSKFYVEFDKKETEEKIVDPEVKLINAFFNHCELYRDECLDEQALEGEQFIESELITNNNLQ